MSAKLYPHECYFIRRNQHNKTDVQRAADHIAMALGKLRLGKVPEWHVIGIEETFQEAMAKRNEMKQQNRETEDAEVADSAERNPNE